MSKRQILYTIEEDTLLLNGWYLPSEREKISQALKRTRSGCEFRYYSLLREFGIDPQNHAAILRTSGSNPEAEEKLQKYHNQMKRISKKDMRELIFQDNVEYLQNISDNISDNLSDKALPANKAVKKDDFNPIPITDSNFKEDVSQIKEKQNTHGESFIEVLENIVQIYKASSSDNSSSNILEENKELRKKISRLRQENEELKRTVEDMEQNMTEEKARYLKAYNEIEFWIGQFMNMSSVDKIANMSEVMPRVKVAVDKFGNVIGVKK